MLGAHLNNIMWYNLNIWELVPWIDIFEVSISIANLRNELKCVLKATVEIEFSGVAFFVRIIGFNLLKSIAFYRKYGIIYM